MASTGQVVIKILGDVKDLQKALSDGENAASSFEDKMKKIGGRLTSVGKTLTAGVTAPIVGFLTAATVAAAGEAEEVAKLNQVLQNSAGFTDKNRAAVEKQITAWQNATGIADGKLRPALANLVIAGMDWSQSQKSMGIAMDIATARGLDLESVTKALGKAYGGSTASLSKLGIATTDAAGNALTFDQIMANAAATMGGSAAAAADTTAGRMKILKARFADITEQIGSNLLPVVEKIGNWLAKLANKFETLSPAAQKTGIVIALLAAAMGPLVLIAGSLVTAIGALASPFVAVGAAVAVLVAATVALYVKWDQVWSWMKDHPAIAAIIVLLTGPISMPIIALVALLRFMRDKWDDVWRFVSAAAITAYNKAKPVFAALDSAIYAIGDAARWVGARMPAVWAVISGAIDNAWSAAQPVIGFFKAEFHALVAVIDWLAPKVIAGFGVVATTVQTAWTAAQPGLEAIGLAIGRVVEIIGWLVDHAPGAWDTFANAISTAWGIAQGPIDAMRWTIGVLSDVMTTVGNLARGAWTEFSGAITDAWSVVQGPLNWIMELVGKMGEVGAGIAKAVVNGFRSVYNHAAGLINDIIPDHVPLPFGMGFDLPNPMPQIPALAAGGIVNRPTLALIGEAGPEAVVPLGGRRSSAGGTTIQLVVDGRVLSEIVRNDLISIGRANGSALGAYA